MIVVVDCGSTKSDWAFVSGPEEISLHNTMGFNPFYHSTEFISQKLEEDLLDKIDADAVEQIWWYGTGIHDEGRAATIRRALDQHFTQFR